MFAFSIDNNFKRVSNLDSVAHVDSDRQYISMLDVTALQIVQQFLCATSFKNLGFAREAGELLTNLFQVIYLTFVVTVCYT